MRLLSTLGLVTSLMLGSASLSAEASKPLFYGQSVGVIASDAPAVLEAMDAWRTSKDGKAGNNTVVLLQNVVNGDYNSTHQVNIFYPDGAAMDQSAQTTASSPAWKEFQSALRKAARPEWENTYAILRAKMKPGDISSSTPTSIIFAITVTDGARFMRAFDDFWGSPAIQEFPGAVYLGEVIAAGAMPGTHFVTFVADTRGKLTEAMMALQGTEAMASYTAAASGTRTLEATNMTAEIKRWVNN
jgi:hypothetical protein